MSEMVKCYRCDKTVPLLANGTYGKHGWGRGATREICKYSGQTHERHSGEFRIVKRNPNVWLCQCLCGEGFLGEAYDDVEHQWSVHRETTGQVAL